MLCPGPSLLLFFVCLFMNTFPLFIDEAYLDFYADDSTLHTSHKQKQAIQDDLQQGSDNFENWCITNDMRIHLQKTCCMSVGTRQAFMNTDSLDRECLS